jgi:hypothetical protein
MKDKNTAINEMVELAADIMEGKLEFFRIMVEQYEATGEALKAHHWQVEYDKTAECVSFMREREGCWA